MVSSNKFAALAPIIRDICRISGIPGIALGVLHQGEVVYTAAYGFADVEKQAPCDEDTTFVLGSLTKAMTAALVSSLIHDGSLLSWDVPLKTILPDFNRSDAYGDATIADLLCHRTGLAALDSLWLASDNVPFLARSQAVRILNHAPAARTFRSHFVYNNFAYEVLGQVIDVEHHEDSLYVSYMGRDADTFELVPYQEDSFYWRLSYDDCVKLARETGYDKEYLSSGLVRMLQDRMLHISGGCMSMTCQSQASHFTRSRRNWYRQSQYLVNSSMCDFNSFIDALPRNHDEHLVDSFRS